MIGVPQGETYPKPFSSTFENAMCDLKWEGMGMNTGDRELHHLRFGDDIVLLALSITQVELMLSDFDRAWALDMPKSYW